MNSVGIADFFNRIFGSRNSINISVDHVDSACTSIAVDVFTLQIAVNLIASCIAKCEFKTFLNNKEVKKDDYYSWNIEPNKNQNSSEFIQKLVSKLILHNEALVINVNGEYLVADNFHREQFGINEDYFEGVRVKTLDFNRRFYMHEVFYYRYNNEDVRAYINSLMYNYNELLELAKGKYKRAGGRKGVIHLDTIASGDKDKKDEIEKMYAEGFKKYFESENATVSIPKGVDYQEQNGDGNKKSANELPDVMTLVNSSFNCVAQALKIPPALLKGETANIKDLVQNFMSFCIAPLVDLIETENNRKLYGKEVLKGNYMKIATTNIIYRDMFSIAEKIDKIIASGVLSVDNILAALGMPEINEDWSKKHWITKNYQDITTPMEGGELNSE